MSIKNEVFNLLDEWNDIVVNIRNDPDGGYEADTMAIIQALDEIGEELAIVLEAME